MEQEINIDDLFTEEKTIEAVEEVEETIEEEVIEETGEEVEETTETEEPKESSLEELEIEFLGEKTLLKDIPREELKEFYQKGKNQERFAEKFQKKLDTANDTISDFKDIAEIFDLDVKGLKETLLEQHFTNKAEEEDRNISDVKKEFYSNKKDSKTKMYDKFFDNYPDVKSDDIPEEVLNMTNEGSDLSRAYKDFETDNKITDLNNKIAELEKTLKVEKQNNVVRKKSIVKPNTGGNGDVKDSFLNEIDSILNKK